jgi:hypothetical protein
MNMPIKSSTNGTGFNLQNNRQVTNPVGIPELGRRQSPAKANPPKRFADFQDFNANQAKGPKAKGKESLNAKPKGKQKATKKDDKNLILGLIKIIMDLLNPNKKTERTQGIPLNDANKGLMASYGVGPGEPPSIKDIISSEDLSNSLPII